MKLNKFIMVAAAAAMMSLTMNSCKDECKDVDCGHGSCDEGNCTCETGYEGDNCDIEERAKFYGTYTGNETCTTGSDNYQVTVTSNSAGITSVSISNIYNQSFIVSGTVSGTSVSIPSQSVGSSTTVSGNGSISGNQLTITYEISSPLGTNSCTYIGSK